MIVSSVTIFCRFPFLWFKRVSPRNFVEVLQYLSFKIILSFPLKLIQKCFFFMCFGTSSNKMKVFFLLNC